MIFTNKGQVKLNSVNWEFKSFAVLNISKPLHVLGIFFENISNLPEFIVLFEFKDYSAIGNKTPYSFIFNSGTRDR